MTAIAARPGKLSAALAAALLVALMAPSVSSAAKASGRATLKAQPGKAKTNLFKKGAKLRGVGKGKATKATLAVATIEFGNPVRVEARGALHFLRGKRSVVVRDLVFKLRPKSTVVTGLVGGRQVNVLRAHGRRIDLANTVALAKASLALTPAGAKALGPKLGIERLRPGRLGELTLNAVQNDIAPRPQQPEQPKPHQPEFHLDPYFAQCGFEATSKVTSDAPAPPPLPILSDAKSIVGPHGLTWSIKSSFANYVQSVHALNGASRPGSAFQLPVAGGGYAVNDLLDTSDDQAVVDLSGTALFCMPSHEFRVAISNPTIVIDGEDSRIVADFDSNFNGVWIPDHPVAFASLDLEGITPFYNHSGSEVTWEAIPATLTGIGAEALCGGDSHCPYGPGTELDPITVTINTPYETGAQDAAAWNALAKYVEEELPFPLPQANLGGCDLTVPAGGSTAAARTIDENHAYGGSTSTWAHNGARSAPVPDLTGPTVTEGRFDWGFRSSLRASINATGEFNLFGTSASHSPYYGFGGLTPISSPRTPQGEMGAADRYFSWPVSNGVYDAGNPANDKDDRLVVRTTGRVAFCQTQSAQLYGTVFSNPTIVIDGAKSRITIDVMTRYRLSWVRGTVDVASLDLNRATILSSSESGIETVQWTFDGPSSEPATSGVTLTKAGEAVLRALSPNTYVEGLPLDGSTITVSFPSE